MFLGGSIIHLHSWSITWRTPWVQDRRDFFKRGLRINGWKRGYLSAVGTHCAHSCWGGVIRHLNAVPVSLIVTFCWKPVRYRNCSFHIRSNPSGKCRERTKDLLCSCVAVAMPIFILCLWRLQEKHKSQHPLYLRWEGGGNPSYCLWHF